MFLPVAIPFLEVPMFEQITVLLAGAFIAFWFIVIGIITGIIAMLLAIFIILTVIVILVAIALLVTVLGLLLILLLVSLMPITLFFGGIAMVVLAILTFWGSVFLVFQIMAFLMFTVPPLLILWSFTFVALVFLIINFFSTFFF